MITRKKLFTQVGINAAISCTAVFIAVVAIWFVNNGITATAEKIVEQKKLSATLAMRNQVVAKLIADAKQSRGAKERIEAALLPANNVLEFVGAVESMALKDNITASLRFDTPAELPELVGNPLKHVYQIPFTLSVQGNILTFVQYLKDIEALPYFTKITAISISASQGGGWLDTSNISVRGILFTRGDK